MILSVSGGSKVKAIEGTGGTGGIEVLDKGPEGYLVGSSTVGTSEEEYDSPD